MSGTDITFRDINNIVVESDGDKLFKFDVKAQEIIANRIGEETDFPKVVLIDNISCCNLKCSMCFHKSMNRKKGVMSWELYKKIIDEIAENSLDTQIWITFFGEGLILKDISERIKYAKDKEIKNVLFNTNGNLLTPEKSRKLIESGLNGMYVGIDAFKKETYEKIRVGGNFDVVVNEVIKYKELLDEIGKEDQHIYAQFVEMDINSSELDNFIKFWHKEHGITCKIRPMVSWGGKADLKATNLLKTDFRLPCYWAMNTINITDQGKVALCSVDLDCECEMGDITKSSIKEIWNTSLREFRNNHRYGNWNKIPKLCQNCRDWQSGYNKYL